MAEEVLTSTLENVTAEATMNATSSPPSTPEGMALAYGSLFTMAIVSIYLGARKSVHHHAKQKDTGEVAERMTGKDAAMFPIYASCFLFGIFMVFKIFGKEYVNMLLSFYFLALGVFALAHMTGPFWKKFIPEIFPNANYHIRFTEEVEGTAEEIVDAAFDRKDLVVLAICCGFGGWYIYSKHWVANNIIGLAFTVNGIEFLQLNTVGVGCILLSGLFLYDIFWVFGTDVMVTVAKNFDGPIKLVFPQDFIENQFAGEKFAMLGLGDLVIPGIFIAIMLRFDHSRGSKSHIYFWSCYLAYILGLGLTIFIMHYFKHAQPALLYLVPCCILIPLTLAAIKGDVGAMFAYEDHTEPPNSDGELEPSKKNE